MQNLIYCAHLIPKDEFEKDGSSFFYVRLQRISKPLYAFTTNSIKFISYTATMKYQLERITLNPEICHGKPCVRGMRWPVEVILDLMGSGMTQEEILEDHPELEKEEILA